jgi:syntaxin 18
MLSGLEWFRFFFQKQSNGITNCLSVKKIQPNSKFVLENMDQTALFKACVKTVRLKRKNLPIPETNDKHRILKKTKDDFNKRTKNIVYQISQLKNFLVENVRAYMQFASHLKSYNQTSMTDEERDFIDIESEKIIDICTKLINDFKNEYSHKRTRPQESEHINAVFEIVSSYLKAVYNIYHTQKHYRIQREIETYKFLKLDSERKIKDTIVHSKVMKNQNSETSSEELLEDEESLSSKRIEKPQQTIEFDDDMTTSKFNYDDEITAEDLQIFESENLEIFKNLKGLSEEVEQIERNVVDIAKLQEIFTEKVRFLKVAISHILLIF